MGFGDESNGWTTDLEKLGSVNKKRTERIPKSMMVNRLTVRGGVVEACWRCLYVKSEHEATKVADFKGYRIVRNN